MERAVTVVVDTKRCCNCALFRACPMASTRRICYRYLPPCDFAFLRIGGRVHLVPLEGKREKP